VGQILMKTLAIETLTPLHLKKLHHSVYVATAFAIFIVVFSFIWMIFRFGGDESNVLFADAMYAIASLFGACLAFRTAYLARKGPLRLALHHQCAWLCVGIGLLTNSLGGTYYTYLEAIHMSPFPSYSDIGFTLLYPFTFVGLLLMPTALRFRVRMGLDALITTLSIFGISWFFVLSPVYFADVKHTLSATAVVALFVGLSYPCWDILLILAIALIIQRRTEKVLYPSFLLLASGLAAFIWADTGYAYTNIFTQTYQSGTPWIDPFWFIGYALMGLAGLYQYMKIVQRAYQEQQGQTQLTTLLSRSAIVKDETEVANSAWRRLQSLLVYIPLVFVLGLTLLGEFIYKDERTNYLVVLTACIGILVAIRYLRATHENEALLQERERERCDAEHLRQLSIELTGILDVEPLLENVAHLATKELGFDAALLMLLEKPFTTEEAQPCILVNTSSMTTPPTNWRLQKDTFFSYLVKDKQDIEIRWDTLAYYVPPEINAWQQEQGILTMQFFPLLYQNTILGCLGVARRTAFSLNTYDISLLHKYVEQVVTVVKHAYLYKETCEHEAFARAIANIATRLNAAVVAPAEIQQILCLEGANALDADHTILYVAGDRGQLVSLAAYNARVDIQLPPNEWPPILPDEIEAQVFYALQPKLIQLQTATTSNTGLFSQEDKENVLASLIDLPGSSQKEQLRDSNSLLREKLQRHSIATAILAPLISGGEPVGMLIFGRSISLSTRNRQFFDSEALSMAQDFAEQASVAFTNAYLYQHLRSAHEKMQALDQLKDQFMVTASHELRTPLTAVQGYIELLSQYDALLASEQRREFLQKARRSCDELVVMLGNVMDASRLEVEAGIRAVPLERVAVSEAVGSVITIIEPQLQQEQRQIQLAIPGDIYVLADPARLRQVLMNISVNALKYSPPSTPIRFSAFIDTTNAPSVILSITDKGKGITLQDQAQLFQRFVRLERDVNSSVRGSGLGLYISRRLVEAIGGTIWIESSGVMNEGSTFHIRLAAA